MKWTNFYHVHKNLVIFSLEAQETICHINMYKFDYLKITNYIISVKIATIQYGIIYFRHNYVRIKSKKKKKI